MYFFNVILNHKVNLPVQVCVSKLARNLRFSIKIFRVIGKNNVHTERYLSFLYSQQICRVKSNT